MDIKAETSVATGYKKQFLFRDSECFEAFMGIILLVMGGYHLTAEFIVSQFECLDMATKAIIIAAMLVIGLFQLTSLAIYTEEVVKNLKWRKAANLACFLFGLWIMAGNLDGNGIMWVVCNIFSLWAFIRNSSELKDIKNAEKRG